MNCFVIRKSYCCNLLIKGSTNARFSTQSLLLNFQINSYTAIDMHIDYVILSLFRKPNCKVSLGDSLDVVHNEIRYCKWTWLISDETTDDQLPSTIRPARVKFASSFTIRLLLVFAFFPNFPSLQFNFDNTISLVVFASFEISDLDNDSYFLHSYVMRV